MGRKIKPVFSRENEQDIEKSEFEKEIINTNFEKAISICRMSKDKKGHSCTIGFKMPDVSGRLVEEIMSREKRFSSHSDVSRTAFLLGIKHILSCLKKNGAIGDSLDDCLLAVEEISSYLKNEELSESIKQTFGDLRILSVVYREDKSAFQKKINDIEKKIQSVRDSFWRKHLLNEFRKKLRLVKDGDLE